jgi:hypothetical protein
MISSRIDSCGGSAIHATGRDKDAAQDFAD